MNIPFSPPYIDDDVIAEVVATLKSGWITTGPKTIALEKETAAYCGIEKALAVNSATSAMMLVLHWFGVTKGDEVILPAYTYCATALAVMHLGATPVIVDVATDFNIDPEKIKAAITAKTKVILTVDFGGWPCDYQFIFDIVNDSVINQKFKPSNEKQKNLGRILIVDDAAHAFGAIYKNKVAGSYADITIFSFHAVKNITTAEGGIICFNMPQPFNNVELYNTLRLWSLNGQTKDALSKSKGAGWKYDIVYPGFKMNMPDLLAAVGLAQMRKYKTELLVERKRVFDFYTQTFSDYPWAICPAGKNNWAESSCHLYALRINGISEQQRDDMITEITKEGIAVNVHFIPLPLLSVFKNRGYNIDDYPVAYSLYSNEISLPIYPQLTNEMCGNVASTVINAIEKITSVRK